MRSKDVSHEIRTHNGNHAHIERDSGLGHQRHLQTLHCAAVATPVLGGPMKTIIRDTAIKKALLFDCKTAKRIAWVIMAFAAGYFISSFLWHIFL